MPTLDWIGKDKVINHHKIGFVLASDYLEAVDKIFSMLKTREKMRSNTTRETADEKITQLQIALDNLKTKE